MSVEEPRLFNISEENRQEEFYSDISEEVARSLPLQEQIELAQAGGNQAPTTGRLPPNPVTPPVPGTTVVEPDSNNVAHLAANVSIDEIRIDGANLILVQADGTEIVIVNGATKVPTILIGEVELQQQVFLAALEDNGINVAAGPDGSYSASARPSSSGGEFDTIQQSQNGPIRLASLLGDSDFGDGSQGDNAGIADDVPVGFDMSQAFRLVESALGSGAFENETITGVLEFDPGTEYGTVSSVAFVNALNLAEGTSDGSIVSLTSGGVPVVLQALAVGGTPDAPVLTLIATANGVPVFTLTVTNVMTGDFTFTQFQPLDHTDRGEIGANDILRLNFEFTVADLDGDPSTATFMIDIGDDGPVAGSGTASTVEDEAVNGGNNEADGLSASVQNISLNITWGADSANDGNGQPGDRSVAFTNANIVVSGAYGTTLTSSGQLISTTVLPDGTLVGYTGSAAPTAATGEGAASVVFYATVSDANNGEYSFTLVKPLDHAAGFGENTLTLTFGYTATDADGDTSSNTFAVSIVDDAPVATGGAASTVEDEAVNAGNDEADGLTASVQNISLNINWGADSANDGNGQPGDRSVAFTNANVGISGAFDTVLTSSGQAVSTVVLSDGTLVGYTGSVAPTAATGANVVFYARLSDANNGEYSFTLVKPLDHVAGSGENTLALTFGYTAADADGDTSSNTFTVSIVDDAPVAGQPAELAGVDEDDLVGGNDVAKETLAGSADLGIFWGSDNVKAGDAGVVLHRTLAFNGLTAALAELTSDGVALQVGTVTGLPNGGQTVTVYKGDPANGEAVFTIILDPSLAGGRATFELQGNLDHRIDGEAVGQLTLNFGYTATDADGDSIDGNFSIIVTDDAPAWAEAEEGVLDEAGLVSETEEGASDNASGSLEISWGSDDNNPTGEAGSSDRSVVFHNIVEGAVVTYGDGAALTSDGQPVRYHLSDDGRTLTGYTGENIDGGTVIFTVTLDDGGIDGKGAYDFTLLRTFDGAQSDEGTVELDFAFQATDSDGDSITGSFGISVIDGKPSQGEATNGSLTEDDISTYDATDATPEADTTKTATASLGINWGSDDDIRGKGDTVGRTVHFVAEGGNVAAGTYASSGTVGLSISGASLSSGGVPLVYVVTDTVGGGQIVSAYKGTTSGEMIFQVALDPTAAKGSYTFELMGELDHDSGSDAAGLTFRFRGTDADGDNADVGQFTVEIADDAPVRGTAGAAALAEDDISAYSQTDATEADRTVTEAISLGISWGADDDIRSGEDGFGRTVGFANTKGVVASAVSGSADVSAFGLDITGATLTSGGNALTYTLTAGANGGQTLTAYIEGTEAKVFQIVLDPTSTNGSYTLEIFRELDHSANSDSATLSFRFRATDADGDQAEVGTATVTIADDGLVIGTPQFGRVDEDGFPRLESGGGNPGPIFGGGDTLLVATVTTRSLDISWGADDSNDVIDGGVTGDPVVGDRSVVFGENAVPTALTSNGFAIVYEVSEDGTELTAYRFQDGRYYDANGWPIGNKAREGDSEGPIAKEAAAVFKITLSDEGAGSYTFTLIDNIDQARGKAENNTRLDFDFVARDADGDSVTNSFTVSIDDDTPVLGLFPSLGGVDEDDLGKEGDVTSRSLNIFWGADRANAMADGGFSEADGDRFVVFGRNSAPRGLTSNGISIRYEVSENGTLLTAYRYQDGHYFDAQGNDLGTEKTGAAVFTVSLSDQGSGSFTFTLIDNLDHDGFAQGGIIPLGFDFKAVDGDGDSVGGSFYVTIDDDTPWLSGAAGSSVDEDGLSSIGDWETYPASEGTGSDLEGASTSTGAVSLSINWGADADLKSEYVDDERPNHDDPIGREVAFVRAGKQVAEIGIGRISDTKVETYLGETFAGLKSDGVPLDYRIDYLRDASGNWNGGYVLTAYKGGTNANVAENQVFKVTLDPTTAHGSYTFDLIGNLDHDGTDAEDDITLTFHFRATDSDGDSTGRSSFSVTIDDDAPVADIAYDEDASLVSDEAYGVQDDTDDVTSGIPEAFYMLGGKPFNWSQQAEMVSIAGAGYGADGAGSLALALTTAEGAAFNGEDSGVRALDGSTVALYTDGNFVFGKAGTTVVFALMIDDDGTVTLAQYHAVQHADAEDPNDAVTVDGIYVTLTISDRENDTTHATTSAALNIRIVDDAPVVHEEQARITVDEDGLSTGNDAYDVYDGDAEASYAVANGQLNYNLGVDGLAGEATNIVFDIESLEDLGLRSFGKSLAYGWDNDTNTLTALAGEDGPVVFTLQVTDVTNGAFTFTLERPLDHDTSDGANTEDDIDIDFRFTIEDGDGDRASGSVTVTIDDDAPFIDGPENETVDEANLPYTLLGPGNDEANPDSATSVVRRGDLGIRWGADDRDAHRGPDVSVRFGENEVPAGLTSNGDAVHYEVVGNTLVAYAGSGLDTRLVFTVSLDDDGTGQYAFRLLGNIDHKGDDAGSKTLSFNFIAEDSDNDEAAGSFSVEIVDGGPSIGAVENEIVKESNLPADLIDLVLIDTDYSAIQLGNLAIDWGADASNSGSANRSVTFDGALDGANSGLTHDGDAIIYSLSNGGTVLSGMAGNTEVFRVTLSDLFDGSYTFVLYDNIDHSKGIDLQATLNFGFVAKDSDGDEDASSFSVTIVDGTPEAGSPGRQTVEEQSGSPAVSNVSLGIDWKSDNNNGGAQNRSVSFAASAPSSITNAAGHSVALYSDGRALSYALITGMLVAYVGDEEHNTDTANWVFSVALADSNSGRYTFTLFQTLDHQAPSGTSSYVDLRFLYTAADSDGDSDGAGFTVRVDAAGSISNGGSTISYSGIESGIFVNLGNDSVTVNGQTVAGDTATDIGTVADKVLGRDEVDGVINITGGAGSDVLVGGSEGNTIRGGAGSDTIIGGLGDDTLEGGAGNDLFIHNVGDGADRIDGGRETFNTWPNYDVLRVTGDAQARTFDIGRITGGSQINAGAGDATDITVAYSGANGATIRADEIEGIEIVAGTGAITVNVGDLTNTAVLPATIHITGSNSATGDVVNAGGVTATNPVSVVFDGNDGNDTFTGGAGNDVARGGSGNDTLTGGAGADTIEGGAGSDIINLGADKTYGAGINHSFTVAGNVALSTSASGLAGTSDSIDGGGDAGDILYLNTGNQGFLLDGNQTTIKGMERIVGSGGNDVIIMKDDYVSDEFAGRTTIQGGGGDDILIGGAANDVIEGGEGNDRLAGAKGADIIKGGTGKDVLWGGQASDSLYGNDTSNTGADLNATAGEEDRASYAGSANNYRVFWDPEFGKADAYPGIGIWRVEALSGAPEYMSGGPVSNTDNLYGIEKIAFLDGTTLDLLAPVRVFNGTALVGTYRSIQAANDAASTLAGYRIELSGTVTSSATINKEDLTVVGGAEDAGITLTLSGVQKITLAGDAPINVVGDGFSNAVQGNDGSNQISGGVADDVLKGGAGNDVFLYTAGDGADIIDGGSETGDTNPNYDILRVSGDNVARTFTVAKEAAGTDIVPGTGSNSTDIRVSYTGANGAVVRVDEIERLEVNLGNAGDTLVLGDLAGTAIAPSTVTINGGLGNDTIDLRRFAGTKVVITDADGIDAGDQDTLKLAGRWRDYDISQAEDGTFTLQRNGAVIATAKNIEQFFFAGEIGGTVSAQDLLNDAPVAAKDTNAADPVIEAGGGVIPVPGDSSAAGRVLDNDADADQFDELLVTSIKFGSGTATAVTVAGVQIEGTYGTLTIHADGSYRYDLDNSRAATQKLAANTQQTEVFTYEISDVHGRKSTAELDIAVQGTNDAPVLSGTIEAVTMPEDTVLAVTLAQFQNWMATLVEDAETADENLSYKIVIGNNTVVFDGLGSAFPSDGVSFTPPQNFSGTLTGTLKVSDGTGAASKTFSIVVTPDADAPAVNFEHSGELTALGDETTVNSTIAGGQRLPVVAALENGGHVVVWQSFDQDGSLETIVAQRFDGNGNPLGSETIVNATTGDSQVQPSVAATTDGGYVVIWQSSGNGFDLYGQRFHADGSRNGEQFSISGDGDQHQVTVTALDNGGFVVSFTAWDGDAGTCVFAQVYNSEGGGSMPFLVNTFVNGTQGAPSIASVGDGFVVVWNSFGQDQAFSQGVYGQRYTANGRPIDGEFRVNVTTAGFEHNAVVTGLPNGGFVVTWMAKGLSDVDGYDVFARVFDANGQGGSEFQVNTGSENDQDFPSVAALPDGGFLITWTSFAQDAAGTDGIYGQRFDSNGVKVGNEFLINSDPAGDQTIETAQGGDTAIAVTKEGNVVVIWTEGNANAGGESAQSVPGEIEQRIFTLSPFGTEDMPVSLSISVALTDTDGSESLTRIVLSGFPENGGTLSAGVKQPDGSWVLTPAQLGNLTYAPPKDWSGSFTLKVAATSTETANGDTATTTATQVIDIRPVADGAIVSLDPVVNVGDSDASVTIPVAISLSDSSESVTSIRLSGFPAGATFSVGHAAGATWVIDTPADIAGLASITMTPPGGYSGTFTLSMTVDVTDTAVLSTGSLSDLASTTATANVTIAAGNAAPVAGHDTLASVLEDSGVRVISIASLLDNDSIGPGDSGQTLTITAIDHVVGGTATIVDRDIYFAPDANFNGTASFDYTVIDNGRTNGADDFKTDIGHVSFEVTPVNDLPLAVIDSGTMTEDVGSAIFSVLANDTMDSDAGASNAISVGTRVVGANQYGIDGSDVMVSLASDNKIAVTLVGSDWQKLTSTASVTVTVNYTLLGNNLDSSSSQLRVTVNGVNDAPVLATTASLAMSMAEDAAAPVSGTVGTLVSSFVDLASAAGGLDNVSDVDSFIIGIAITALNTTNGSWYWSPNGGTNWITAGAVSNSNALLLYSNYQLYFRPNAGYNGAIADAITFRAWDHTGTPGQYVDTTANGGTTGFSTATDTVSLTVTPVNDAPVAVDDMLSSVAEDSGVRVIDFASLLDNDSIGPGDSGQTLTITSVSAVTGGTVEIVGADIRFTPDANFNGTASFDYTVSDNGQTNGLDDFKTNVGRVSFQVTPVNDIPVARFDTGSMVENGPSQIFDVLANDTKDVDAGAPNNISIGTVTIGSNSYGLDADDLLVEVTGDNKIQVTLVGTDWDKLSNGAMLAATVRYTLHGDQSDVSSNQLALSITGVNDTPVLVTTAIPSMFVAEDAATPVSGTTGTPVSSFVDLSSAAGGLDNVNDDSFVVGMAITGLNGTNGTWYWSANGGGSWTAFGAVSASNALLLGADYQLYFKPNANYFGTIEDAITFRAWDPSFGGVPAGNYVNLSGGLQSISTATDTVSLTVTPVNDAPQISGLASQSIVANTAGALIDTFVVSDIDTTSGITFRVLKGGVEDSRFEVVASGAPDGSPGTYELRLKAGHSLDFETENSDGNPTIGLTVEADDHGTGNSLASAPVTVTVTDINEAGYRVAASDTISLVPAGWNWFADNGHIYQTVTSSTLWQAALQNADAALGGAGYLATVTSAAEWSFILSHSTNVDRISLGGSDSAEFSSLNSAIREGTWAWVTGPEAGTVFWSSGSAVGGAFTDWGSGNPNNLSGEPRAENYLATDLQRHWNDISENNSLVGAVGYVIEAGAPGATYAAINEDAVFTFSANWLLANDTGSPTSLALVSGTTSALAHITYDAGTGLITYDPTGSATLQALAGGATFNDTFSYTIDDGHGGLSTATVTLTVAGVDEAPSANFVASDTESLFMAEFQPMSGDGPDHVLIGTDGDDILAGLPGMTEMTGGKGADTFVLDPSALNELDMADVITDYKFGEGDALDVSNLLDQLLGHPARIEDVAANVRSTITGSDTTIGIQMSSGVWQDVAVLQNHTEAIKILFDEQKHSTDISHA
ncbi:T1SS-143 repeat domain-containing protein [Rhizobium terrae]|uniref:T1SS-143 repeat domain-containing protein n=1 Tax=Rhizobium terrae TaxID=2171756 RepID=UPI000E3C9038|nr:DUF5801 repeats-in-toxin domain-containing protein [Rhizobium terrae]